MVCDTHYLQNEFGDPKMLSFSTCCQSFKKIVHGKVLGVDVLHSLLSNYAVLNSLGAISLFTRRKCQKCPKMHFLQSSGGNGLTISQNCHPTPRSDTVSLIGWLNKIDQSYASVL